MTTRRWASSGFLMLMLAACWGDGDGDYPYSPPPAGELGELGRGRFVYTCAGDSDAMCDDGVDERTLDRDLALGARFGMEFTGTGFLQPASDLHLKTIGARGVTFEALALGPAALISHAGDRDIDVLHVFVATVDSVDIYVDGSSNELVRDSHAFDLADGELALRAIPQNAETGALAGALPCAWSIDDPSVVAISGDLTDNVVRLDPQAVGTALLTLQLGELTRELTIEVTDEFGGLGGMPGAGGMGGGAP